MKYRKFTPQLPFIKFTREDHGWRRRALLSHVAASFSGLRQRVHVFFLSFALFCFHCSERNKGGQETLTTQMCLTDGPLFLSAPLYAEQGKGNDRNGQIWENQIRCGG